MDSVGLPNVDSAANFLADLAALVYVDPEITENILKVNSRPNKRFKYKLP